MDVQRIAVALPGVVERQARYLEWRVAERNLAWERPLRRSDLAALGDAAPEGPVLAVRTADEGVKQALIADDPTVFFTTPHFDGYPAVLIRLADASTDLLTEVITEAWLARAPKRLTRLRPDLSGEGPS
jgi:hypothetical protein